MAASGGSGFAGRNPAIRRALGESHEFQSALIRFPLGLGVLGYLYVGYATGQFAVQWFQVSVLYGVHLVIFVLLFRSVLRQPAFKRWRSDLSIVMDLSATTTLIYLSGDPLSPLYLIYIVLFISQGTRYGRRNLVLSATGGLLCFSAIVTLMGGWMTHPVQAGFILLALAVLPLYQHSLLRNLQKARRRAEAANQARGDFLATMSHELRTPLSGILGMARLLGQNRLQPEQRRCVDSICSSGETLHTLIGDVLDLSKVDAGELELHREHFDLRKSLLDVCCNMSQDAVAKEVELVCCIDGMLPEHVFGDRVRFEQVLYNLIGNGVKFTPAGRVCIEAERTAAQPELGREHLEIVIGDTGIGIPRDRLDCIFESFWQADTRASRRFGGTGLGTTIAHRLVRSMGGHISVDSEEGQGTTFRLRLPCLPDPDNDRPPRPPEVLAGHRVVIDECDPEARSALESLCRHAGMDVISCSDQAELDRRLIEVDGEPAPQVLIVADTPAGRDLEAVAAQVCERVGRALPTVQARYDARPLASAAPDVLVTGKPWHPVELWGALESALRQSDTTTVNDSTTAAENGQPASSLRILVVEDDRVNADLAELLLRHLGYCPVVARDGVQALERLASERFDLVLADLRMPGMDGIEFTRALRARESGGVRVPVVALTASVSVDTRERGLAAGMDDCLSKPIDATALEVVVGRLVPRAGCISVAAGTPGAARCP